MTTDRETPLTDEEMARLEALAREATPGKRHWEEVNGRTVALVATSPPGAADVLLVTKAVSASDDDAAFLAATDPQNVLRLLAELRFLRAVLHDEVSGTAAYEEGRREGLRQALEAVRKANAAAYQHGDLAEPTDVTDAVEALLR